MASNRNDAALPVNASQSSSHPEPSCSLTNQVPLTISEDDILSLRSKWKEAVDKWEEKLVTSNSWKENPYRNAIKEFKSWQDLLSDLKRRQAEGQASAWHPLVNRIMPTMKTISKLFPILVAAIAVPGGSKEVAVLWAFLYLGVKAMTTMKASSAELSKMIDKLETKLRDFDRCTNFLLTYSKNEDSCREIASAIVCMFEAIISFWVQAVIALEGNRDIQWPSFNKKSHEALTDATEAVDRISSVSNILGILGAQKALPITEDESKAAGANLPCFCLPPPRNFFHGRVETIEAMRDHLCSPDKKTFCRSFAVYGTPGTGKTGLALHFAYRCVDEKLFDVILWIRAETDTACKQSFKDAELRLGLTPSEDHDASISAVITELRKIKKWLIIYDNLEQLEVIEHCLPLRSVAGSILLTTRYRHIAVKFEGDNLSRELLPFNDYDTIAVFNGFRSVYHQDSASPVNQVVADHGEDAQYIIQVVGGLALGIEHIAAYMENDRLTVAQFRRNYERMTAIIHKKESTGSQAPHTIDTLWEMALTQAEQAGPETFGLLQVLAFLAPDNVSLRLFPCDDNLEWTDFDQDLTEFTFFCNSIENLDTAVTQLQRLALVRRLSGDTISIHRLLQKSIFYKLDQQSRQKVFDVASKLVNMSFPKQINDEPLGDRWDECQDYIEHAQTLASLLKIPCPGKGSGLRASEDLQELMTNSTWYLYESGNLKAAYSLVEEARQMFPDRDNSLHYAHLCNTAAVIYFDWNQLKKSEDEHMRCLRIRSKLLPENHLLISSTIMNLGQVYSALGRFTEAEQKFEEYRQMNLRTGLPVMVQSHGLDCMIIGRALFLQNRLGEARKSFDESRRCLIEAFGDSSVLLAYLMLAYGNLELADNDITEAQIAYQEGYAMAQYLAPTHGLIAALHYKLAFVHHVLGNYELGLSHCKAGIPIADLRQLRGDKARLLYLKSLCFDGLAAKGRLWEDTDHDDAAELRRQAELEKDKLLEIQDIAISPGWPNDEVYDHLVCAYVR